MGLLAKPSQDMFLLAGAALTNRKLLGDIVILLTMLTFSFPHINRVNLLERVIEKSFLKYCQSNLKTTTNCSKNQLTWAQIK